jgi:hypothetical protein
MTGKAGHAGHGETLSRLSRRQKRDATGHTPIGVSRCPACPGLFIVLIQGASNPNHHNN